MSVIGLVTTVTFAFCDQLEGEFTNAILDPCPSESPSCARNANASTSWRILTARSGFNSPLALTRILHTA